MSWLRAVADTSRSGLKVERRRLEPLVALRGAAGLALVIGVSLWLFGPQIAASSAFGAFSAAIATFQRSWRPRPELALASGTSLAVSTFLGYVTVGHLFLLVPLLVLWAFVAGLAWSAGPTVGIIAASNVAMVMVTVTLPVSLLSALGHAGVIAAGGFVQAALVVLFPVRRWGAHRDALADALAAEADYARRLRHDPVAPFDPEPLMEARDAAVLTPRQARSRPSELRGPRGVAEQLRPVLASIADPALGVPGEGPERERVRELLYAAGTVLDAAAEAVRGGEPLLVGPAALAVLHTPDTGQLLNGPSRRAATRLTELLDEVMEAADPSGRESRRGTEGGSTRVTARARGLRTGARTVLGTGLRALLAARDRVRDRVRARTLTGAGAPVAEDSPPAHTVGGVVRTGAGGHGASDTGARPPSRTRPSLFRLVPVALRAMREELYLGSTLLRHAVRVSVVAGLGYLVGTLLPLGHGYWAPLASVMILRPDFAQTYSRAAGRFFGTLLGVTFASVVVRLGHPDPDVLALLAVCCAGLMYLLMRTGYVVGQVCVSMYVVFLLGMGGQGLGQTVPERVGLTLVGGVLAMLAYAVYPAWEAPRLRTRLAEALLAHAEYAAAVVRSYARPGEDRTDQVRQGLLDAREARATWQEAVEKARNEPVRQRGLSRAAADAADEALDEISRVAMLMEAHLPEHGAMPVPAAERLADALLTAAERADRDVRERRVPRWDEVRAALEAWDAWPDESSWVPDRVVRKGAGLLLEAVEGLSRTLAAYRQGPAEQPVDIGETGDVGDPGPSASGDWSSR
ncbi:FUSC family protein [Streptomyces sp. NPDC049954]|uniref:FUSC family protein n=1 Tax=Streptomyces sp. NPDC049954 TaxID=3155779 RepID=UPI00341FFFC8